MNFPISLEIRGLQTGGVYLPNIGRMIRKKVPPRLQELAKELRHAIQAELNVTGEEPAKPGDPPHKKTGRLQRSIKYRMLDDMSVLVGSTGRTRGWYGRLHELGGRVKTKRQILKAYKAGDEGPLAFTRNPPRAALVSQKQADRATKINRWLSRKGADARYYNTRRRLSDREDHPDAGYQPEFEKAQDAYVNFPARPFIAPIITDRLERIPYAFENLF